MRAGFRRPLEVPFHDAPADPLPYLRAHGRLGALTYAVVGLWCTVWSASYLVQVLRVTPRPSLLVLDCAVAMLFLIAGLLMLRSSYWLLTTHPALRVTAEGIVDGVSPVLRVGLIPWEEIVEVRAHKMFGSRTLAIWLREPERVLRRKPMPLRFLLAFACHADVEFRWWRKEHPALNLPWYLVAGDVDRLVQEIHTEYAEVLRRYGIVARRDPTRES